MWLVMYLYRRQCMWPTARCILDRQWVCHTLEHEAQSTYLMSKAAFCSSHDITMRSSCCGLLHAGLPVQFYSDCLLCFLICCKWILLLCSRWYWVPIPGWVDTTMRWVVSCSALVALLFSQLLYSFARTTSTGRGERMLTQAIFPGTRPILCISATSCQMKLSFTIIVLNWSSYRTYNHRSSATFAYSLLERDCKQLLLKSHHAELLSKWFFVCVLDGHLVCSHLHKP